MKYKIYVFASNDCGGAQEHLGRHPPVVACKTAVETSVTMAGRNLWLSR